MHAVFVTRPEAVRRARREERRAAAPPRRAQALQCARIVEDVKAAPVRCQYDVVRARLYAQIANGDRWHIEAQIGPRTPPVETDARALLEPGIQDLGVAWIFANDVHRLIRRRRAGDGAPMASEIFRREHVRTKVAGEVAVDRDVRARDETT